MDEHLMTIGAEECNEIAQRFSKAIRFGQDQIQPGQDLTNRHRILREFADLVAVMQALGFAIPSDSLEPWVREKHEKMAAYIAYSESLGLVEAGVSQAGGPLIAIPERAEGPDPQEPS